MSRPWLPTENLYSILNDAKTFFILKFSVLKLMMFILRNLVSENFHGKRVAVGLIKNYK